MKDNEGKNRQGFAQTFVKLRIKDVMDGDPVVIYDDEDLSRAQELFVEKKVFSFYHKLG